MAIFARTAMMNKRSKVSPIYYLRLLSLLFCLTIVTFQSYSSDISNDFFRHFLTTSQDTIPSLNKDTSKIPKDTITQKTNSRDSSGLPKDSLIQKIDTFHVPLSSDSLSAPVNYKAEDSMVMEVATKKIFLYGRSEVKYTEITLNAPEIAFDQASQMVTARMTRDSAGIVVGMAKLTQAETTTVSDSIKFNFKTQKGITHNSFFQQQEIYNFAEKVKKIDAETFYAYRGRFTTCNLDTPHFAFRFNKAKFVNQKVVVTGPVHPEFEGVPIPIYLPFGIFPLSTGRHSGILPPQLTFTQDFGVGIEGLGYYKVFNDYLDAKIWSDIYSYGTWRLNFAPTYRVRYKYSGGLTLSFQNTKFAFKGDPDYSVTKTFFVTWNHSLDSKARPGVTFQANVQAGSSQYLRLVPSGAQLNSVTGSNGNYQQPVNFTNQLSSSISYQKTWQGKPYSLSVNLNHNQNTQTRLINLNLPDIGFNVNTIYPFQPKEFVGESKWYEKLGIGYNGNIKSQVSFYDSTFQFGQIIDTMQWGANHSIPILLSLPSLGPFQIAPNISYRERWFAQKFTRNWNDATEKLDTTIKKGFYSAREVSVGLAVSTAIFGTFLSKNKDARIQAVRHVMRPQFGLSYKPDLMEPYYYREKVDTKGNEVLFSQFDGSIFGPFSPGRSGGISFGLDNNIELKVKNKIETGDSSELTPETEFRKVRLLDGFGFNGGYNFLADSFRLSTISLYARSVLFEKLNITANANLDPYTYDLAGYRKDIYAWQGDKFSLGSITTGSLNISTNFQSKKKDDGKEKQEETDERDYISQDQLMQQMDYMRRNPAEFADFDVAWSLNLGFSLQFAKMLNPDYTGYRTEFSSSLNFNGDFNVSKKWKMGANGFYDVRNLKLQSFTMFFSRDLHCWQMSINITPIGLYRYFSININPKSGLLRDLKINRTRYSYNR